MTCFAGVDVGLDGAIAAIVEGSPAPALFQMPTISISKGNRIRRVIDSPRIRSMFVSLQQQFGEVYVMIERAQMRPAVLPAKQPHKCPKCGQEHLFVNQGIASQANFVGQFERIVGILEGLGISYEDVAPSTWKADVFHGRSEKLDARLLASALYPAIANKLTLKKSDGLAESLLLADYGRRRRNAPF